MEKRTICLLNDSFPPLIDGVSNVMLNYARNIEASGSHALVATPNVPGADDSAYPFEVIRYPSIDTRKAVGYVAGIPFSPKLLHRIHEAKTDLLHLHCPMMSAFMAKQISEMTDLPLIMTWHTKYDIDVANAIRGKMLQEETIKILIQNVNACNEVWTVSEGAGENLRSLGFERDYIVMPNGVDLPKGRVSEAYMQEITGDYDLPADVPVFLFVGRLMWYKGLRIILDALAGLKKDGYNYRMVFVGGGGEEAEIRAYTTELGLDDRVIFTGAVRDREALRAWYCRADLFLFPSTFDTNGLVVREAAACGTGAVLIAGSCASEGVTDGRNGLLIEENAESLRAKLAQMIEAPGTMQKIGEHARDELYLSWEDAVKAAQERYEVVLDKYKSGQYPQKHTAYREFAKAQRVFMEAISQAEIYGRRWSDEIRDTGEDVVREFAEGKDKVLENFRFEGDELQELNNSVLGLFAGGFSRKDEE